MCLKASENLFFRADNDARQIEVIDSNVPGAVVGTRVEVTRDSRDK